MGIVSCEENTGVWALFGTATCGAISIGGIVRVNSPMMPPGQAAVWLSDRLHDACPLLLLQRHFFRGIGGANTSGDSATGAILGESGLT